MSPHVDILEDREPLGRSFAGSIVFHLLLVGAITGAGFVRNSNNIR